jgi:hypothetical protein
MESYVAKRDCYYDGMFLKKGQTIKVAKGADIQFKWLEKVSTDEPVEKKTASKK